MRLESAEIAAMTVAGLQSLSPNADRLKTLIDAFRNILQIYETVTVNDEYKDHSLCMSFSRQLLRRIIALLEHMDDFGSVDKRGVLIELPLPSMPQLEPNPVWRIESGNRQAFGEEIASAMQFLTELGEDLPLETTCEAWKWISAFCAVLAYNVNNITPS